MFTFMYGTLTPYEYNGNFIQCSNLNLQGFLNKSLIFQYGIYNVIYIDLFQ